MIPSRIFMTLPALLIAAPLQAVEQQVAGADAVPIVTGASPWNLVLGLLFLLLIVVGGWWLTRRMGGLPLAGSNRALRVIASTMVGPRERVVLLEVGNGEQLLLGVAPGQVRLLKQLDQPLPIEARAGDDFAARLRQFMLQGGGR
jgi:flagellar protein FliO/FliZ